MEKRMWVTAFAMVFEIGFLLAVPVVVLLLFGLWLDGKLHTTPVFTLIGVVIGFTGGSINTYRAVQKLSRK